MTGEVVSLDAYRERKEHEPQVVPIDIKRRLADIAIEKALLESEERRLRSLLED